MEQPAIDSAIRELYAKLDQAVTDRNPTCWISGRCCNFNEYGHRLYVTGLEVAWFLNNLSLWERKARNEQVRAERSEESVHQPPPPITQIDVNASCPYQINGMCSVHTIRPLGCRIFFCQKGTQDWQQDTFESFLSDIKQLHNDHNIPYEFIEWRSALRDALRALEDGFL